MNYWIKTVTHSTKVLYGSEMFNEMKWIIHRIWNCELLKYDLSSNDNELLTKRLGCSLVLIFAGSWRREGEGDNKWNSLEWIYSSIMQMKCVIVQRNIKKRREYER